MRRFLPVVALALLLACWALVSIRVSAPAPKPYDAPLNEFSAERAYESLRSVLPTNTPHPTGSTEQRRVRARIEARLRELDYAVRVQRTPVCSRYGVCALVENVLAERNPAPGPRVLLAAHYDSVPAGPGGSDDGVGVATLLEVARALRHRTTRLPTLLLFTDGEEAGLLGAEAFVRDELPKVEIAAVVNVEARGTSGAALLFETSGPNVWLVAAFARASPRPVTSSLFPAVYQRLPNDTDLSVFARAGIPGVNFANIGGIAHYHTPQDDLDRLSLRTLQHHGDAALGLAAGLERADPLAGSSLFFDVLGLFVVQLPLRYSPWLYAIASLLWSAVLALAFRRGVRVTRFLRGFGSLPLLVVLATVASLGLGSLLRAAGTLGTGWPAHPEPFFLATGSCLLLLSLALPSQVDSGEDELWLATWTFFGLVGWGVGVLLPEASFLFLLPWSVAAAAGLCSRGAIAVLAPAVAGAILWLPVLMLSYDALGLAIPGLFAACAALGLAGFLPALGPLSARPRRFLVRLTTTSALGCAVIGCIVPPFSVESPQRLSIAYHLDADSGRARLVVDASSGPVPESVLDAAVFSEKIVDPSPTFVGWRPEAREAEAAAEALPAPEIIQVAPGRVRIRSRRGAHTLSLHCAHTSTATGVTFGELAAPLRGGVLTLLGVGAEGTELGIEGGDRGCVIADHTSGLPPQAQQALRARPIWAAPSQAGDETVVSRRASF